jgi:tetratricopeptide (TPR) repeat protein
METGVNHQARLQSLARLLQVPLRSRFHSTPIQLQCALKQGDLLVLGQHRPDSDLDQRQIFEVLQETIQGLPHAAISELFDTASSTIKVRCYLRILGQKQPYAAHSFTYACIAPVVSGIPSLEEPEEEPITDTSTAVIGEQSDRSSVLTESTKELAPDESRQFSPLENLTEAAEEPVEDESRQFSPLENLTEAAEEPVGDEPEQFSPLENLTAAAEQPEPEEFGQFSPLQDLSGFTEEPEPDEPEQFSPIENLTATAEQLEPEEFDQLSPLEDLTGSREEPEPEELGQFSLIDNLIDSGEEPEPEEFGYFAPLEDLTGSTEEFELDEIEQFSPIENLTATAEEPELEEFEQFSSIGNLTAAAEQPEPDEPEPVLPLEDRLQLAELTEDEQLPSVPDIEEPALPTRSGFLRPGPWVWAAIAVGLGAVALASAATWLLSRPCLVGECQPIKVAQELDQAVEQQFRATKSSQDLQQIQQQLKDLMLQLDSIPAWTGKHQEVEQWQQALRSHSIILDQILMAEARAEEATQKGQTIPQSVARWQEVQSLWQQAIDQMRSIPNTSSLSTFAQQQLASYEASLKTAEQWLEKEQRAAKHLNDSKSVAKVAEKWQNDAQNPEQWQKVQVTWQVVINALSQIPNDTSSYAEAQQLLKEYQPILMEVRNRTSQEQSANQAFLQAVSLAQQAKRLEQQNQWSQAISTWKQALNSARNVSQNTFFHEQAQPLLPSYNASLKQAEARFQVAVVQQRVRSDMSRICSGLPRICSYTMTNDAIQVQFTPEYERALKTAFILGQGHQETLGNTVHHLETLQDALQTVANNAGLAVEVYGANSKELIGSFGPKG